MRRGDIHRIDDLITHNLDIERFAADALRDYEGSDFIAAFFAAIAGRKAARSDRKDRRGVTVLDPACGSGAFLFAALNVLEPLYEKCIERMREFIEADDAARRQKHRKGGKRFDAFREVLKDIDAHQNQRYWIYKTVILNNLYGVDLMREAAEIAKLRLFLKLAAEAQYDPAAANLGLEPLPDIDFNIRAGNSLVGFASMAEFEAIAGGELVERRLMAEIREDAKTARMADDAFRKAQNYQDQSGKGGEDYRRAKHELAHRLDALNQNMNRYLAKQYGIDDAKPQEYAKWRQTHRPFHWLAEFYGIIEEDGGFDVVVGNPPYIEYSGKLQRQYRLNGYRTEKAGNLYAFFVERNESIMSNSGWTGMIVPHSAFCTDRMSSLNSFLENKKRWVSTYGTRPAKLFKDAEQNLAIYILSQQKGDAYSGAYTLWSTDYRDCLFQNTCYGPIPDHKLLNTTPKIGDHVSAGVLAKICKHAALPVNERGDHQIYYNNTGRYWTRATDFVPHFWNERDGEKQSTQIKTLAFSNRAHARAVCALLNSSLFYWWFLLCSNCRDLVKREIENFPFNPSQVDEAILAELASITGDLMADYRRHAVRKETLYKTTGKVVYDEFHPGHSKSIMDRIDTTLAKHYRFTEAELDYIINYDIKYRMGRAGDG